MKRIIAIDYGDARTGVAVSDLTGTLAGEALTIQEWNAEKLAQRPLRRTPSSTPPEKKKKSTAPM